jgi:hypothetical protein
VCGAYTRVRQNLTVIERNTFNGDPVQKLDCGSQRSSGLPET